MYYKHPFYLAVAPDQKIYRVNSWLSLRNWTEIPRKDLRYYDSNGEILEKYAKQPFYEHYKGKIVARRTGT